MKDPKFTFVKPGGTLYKKFYVLDESLTRFLLFSTSPAGLASDFTAIYLEFDGNSNEKISSIYTFERTFSNTILDSDFKLSENRQAINATYFIKKGTGGGFESTECTEELLLSSEGITRPALCDNVK